jgi:holo-[acyl-carrier protein] synthase
MIQTDGKLLGLGIDLVDLSEMEKSIQSPSFQKRVYTAGEILFIHSSATKVIHRYAELFAGKEAVMKAMGMGLGQGLWFRQIELVMSKNEIEVYLFGAAALRAFDLGILNWHVSLTHTPEVAMAVAVALSA